MKRIISFLNVAFILWWFKLQTAHVLKIERLVDN